MSKALKTIWKVITAPFRFLFWLGRGIARGFKKILSFFSEDIEDTPLPDAFAKTIENPTGILFHLNELRKHLFRAILSLVITTAISFLFITQILDFMARPLEGGIKALRAVDITESVGTVMKVSLLAGFALAFPYIIFELWMFAAPGLKRSERLFSLLAIPIATLFFIGGMAFAYYLMLPVALPVLLNFMGLYTLPRPNSYFPFVVNLMFWLGISFEFPLAIFVLARLGIVRAKVLADQWRLAIVIITILAAAITTTTDPANMALVMAPMSFLYFLSIGLAYIAQRKREKR